MAERERKAEVDGHEDANEKKNGLKNSWEVNGDNQKVDQVWPEWLPSDWFIWRNIEHYHSSSNVYYSNGKGKRFYSKEEVLNYLSTRKSSKKVSKKSKIPKLQENNGEEEKKKAVKKNNETLEELAKSQRVSVITWPDWLPDDWRIHCSLDNPNDVTYSNPKSKSFKSKDEVLRYLDSQSKKLSQQTRKRITKIKDNAPKK